VMGVGPVAQWAGAKKRSVMGHKGGNTLASGGVSKRKGGRIGPLGLI